MHAGVVSLPTVIHNTTEKKIMPMTLMHNGHSCVFALKLKVCFSKEAYRFDKAMVTMTRTLTCIIVVLSVILTKNV